MRASRVPGLVIVASRGSLGVATPGLLFTGHTVPLSPGAPPPPQPGSLEEILFAVHALPAAEAALGQRRVTVTALEALAVPVAIQGLEDEAVQDVLVAASTQRDLCKARSCRGHGKHGSHLPPQPQTQGC